MSFDTRERSRFAGAPVEFLLLSRGSQAWRYTSAEQARTFLTQVWNPLPGLERGAIEQNAEDITMQLRLTLPRTADVAPEFSGRLAPAPMLVTLWRNHVDEADGEALVIWMGEVAGQKFSGSNLELLCSTEESAFAGQLGQRPYMRACPNMLYDALCGVDPADHTFDATVSAVSADGKIVTVTGPGDLGSTPSHYRSGVLFWTDPELVERAAFIRSEGAAGVFTIVPGLPELPVSATVQVRRGCDKSPGMCTDPFSNLERFAGYAKIPLRDPWKRVT